ncbi:unnamed protein product, partial [Pylaiella littoralis]
TNNSRCLVLYCNYNKTGGTLTLAVSFDFGVGVRPVLSRTFRCVEGAEEAAARLREVDDPSDDPSEPPSPSWELSDLSVKMPSELPSEISTTGSGWSTWWSVPGLVIPPGPQARVGPSRGRLPGSQSPRNFHHRIGLAQLVVVYRAGRPLAPR